MLNLQRSGSATPAMGGAAAQVVVRSSLRSAVRSPANRRRAQGLVWEWVGAKWPKLMPSPQDMERSHLERSVAGQALMVSTSGDGAVWTLSVANNERNGPRTWMTQARVMDAGDVDVVDLQTSCTRVPNAPLVVAPPRLLGDWVERLALEDAGLAVLGTPREVFEEPHRDAFCDHVRSPQRTLPVIALVSRPNSRYYGVDPRGLAEAVSGLAHVACFSRPMATGLADYLGPGLGLVHGAARIYAPGFSASATTADHPLVRELKAQDDSQKEDPGAFRRQLVRKILAINVARGQDLMK